MQIYVQKDFLDINIQHVSKKFNLEIVNIIPLSKYYFTYDEDGLSFIKD